MPVEIKSTMVEHADGQPGNQDLSAVSRSPSAGGRLYCFVDYRPHGCSGCTVLDDKMVHASDLPLLRWHGGDHHDTQ